MRATMFLDDPQGGAFTEKIHLADAPVERLDLAFDTSVRGGGAPAFEHLTGPEDRGQIDPEPTPIVLFCLTRTSGGMGVEKADVGTARQRVAAKYDLSEVADPRVLATAVTPGLTHCALLLDEEGTIHYASTARGAVAKLEEIAGLRITENQQPGLAVSGRDGTLDWVYVRYLDGEEGRIAHVLVEPDGEDDPVHESTH
jgi:hypothetical protein